MLANVKLAKSDPVGAEVLLSTMEVRYRRNAVLTFSATVWSQQQTT